MIDCDFEQTIWRSNFTLFEEELVNTPKYNVEQFYNNGLIRSFLKKRKANDNIIINIILLYAYGWDLRLLFLMVIVKRLAFFVWYMYLIGIS